MTLDLASIRAWLEENCPHIELVQYGGRAKACSTFRNKNTGHVFTASFSNLKSSHKRGREVGLSPEEIQSKKKRIWLKKYGVDHPKKSDRVQDKYKKTCLQKYGSENYFGSDSWRSKSRDVYKKATGFTNPAKNSATKARKARTNQQRYGSKTWAQANAQLYDGYTIQQLEELSGLSRGYIYALLQSGVEPSNLRRRERSTEFFVKTLLENSGVEFVEDRICDAGIRPDFYVPKCRVAIECDGLHWHSDAVIEDPYHHFKRRKQYLDAGIEPLFFREDELLAKQDIVASIIRNKLGITPLTIYARNTEFRKVSKEKAREFTKDNHLMGPGAGRGYGLYYDGTLVTLMQVKWVRTQDTLEISRFCSILNTRVTGGFSKLLKYVVKEESPKRVVTYIDQKYGMGTYLPSLGFQKQSEHVSFRWTKQQVSHHRMKFPGNTGYEQGFKKIYDCGQAKWIAKVGDD